MNRVVRKINTDGIDQPALNDSDILISYEGCGCAGGRVTTIQGEEIIERGWHGQNPTSLGRRKQKIYEDIQGRTWKTEIMNWNGTTPYMTTVTEFDGRDQAFSVTQTEQATSTSQITTVTYDGHGRLKTRHLPQQDANKFTNYNYNIDDSISSVTDARGATTSYGYNARKLPILIHYSVPEPQDSTIPVPEDVVFDYDVLGNRIAMTDGLGTVDYEYNELSQMTAETRDFDDVLPNAPPGGKFKLEYGYNLSGGLKSLEDPYGQQVNYAHDKVGRLGAVTGSSFGGVTNYADNPHYRAWGGLQSLDYGNNTAMSMSFNNRLQANYFQVTKSGQSTPILSKSHSFYADGSIRIVDDLVDNRFDRINTYDHAGRQKNAKSSFEARGETPNENQLYDTPYRQSYTFNAFGNMTERDHLHWGLNNFDLSYTYTNNRIGAAWFQFDADGRETQTNHGYWVYSTYDAAGRLAKYNRNSEYEAKRFYNGNGREEKRKSKTYVETHPDVWAWVDDPPTYYIRSTILGGEVVSDVNSTGEKLRTYVRAAGMELAWQNKTPQNETVVFQHQDASGTSYRTTGADGSIYTGEGSEGGPAELDPLGGNVGIGNPYLQQVPGNECEGCSPINTEMPHYINGQQVRYNRDGMEVPHSVFMMMIDSGWIGGSFGLLEMQARMSIRFAGYSLRFNNGDVQFAGYDFDGAVGQMEGGETLVRNWFVSNQSWALNLSLIPYSEEPERQTQQTRDKKPSDLAPKGTASDKKLTAEECDRKLARLFGGREAVVGSAYDPLTLGHYDAALENAKNAAPNIKITVTGDRGLGHGPEPWPQGGGGDKGGIIHIYADPRGFINGPLYAPAGGNPSRFAFDSLGNRYRRVSYDTGLTISFFHTTPSRAGGRNEMGSVQIGNIGGPGGDDPGYIHSHLIFYSNFAKKERVDPRKVFCGW